MTFAESTPRVRRSVRVPIRPHLALALALQLVGCGGASSRAHPLTPAQRMASRTALVGPYVGGVRYLVRAAPNERMEPPHETVGRVAVTADGDDVLLTLARGFGLHCALRGRVDAEGAALVPDARCDNDGAGGTVALRGLDGRVRRIGETVVFDARGTRVVDRGGVHQERGIELHFTGHPPLVSSIGRFQADFPGVPISRTVMRDGAETTFYLLDLPARARTYALSYLDLPTAPDEGDEIQDVLVRSRDALVRTQVGAIVNTRMGEVRDAMSLDVRYTIDDGRREVRARFVLIGQRLYQIAVTGNYGEVFDNDEVDAFFESFRPLTASEAENVVP